MRLSYKRAWMCYAEGYIAALRKRYHNPYQDDWGSAEKGEWNRGYEDGEGVPEWLNDHPKAARKGSYSQKNNKPHVPE